MTKPPGKNQKIFLVSLPTKKKGFNRDVTLDLITKEVIGN
jgi:hypothetical protein